MAISRSCARSLSREPIRLSALIILTAVCLAGRANIAAAQDTWKVVEQTGPVVHRLSDGREFPLKLGEIVTEGDVIVTGPSGGFALRHSTNTDSITLLPQSQLMIPAAHSYGLGANIIQTMGMVFFHIEHTPGRRFEVDGPYFATIVKGTSFSVAITPANSTVGVSEGAVEVRSPDFGRSVLVGAGQFAYVSASGQHDLSVGRRQSSASPTPGDANSGFANTTQPANTTGDTQLLGGHPAPGGGIVFNGNAPTPGSLGVAPALAPVLAPILGGSGLNLPPARVGLPPINLGIPFGR